MAETQYTEETPSDPSQRLRRAIRDLFPSQRAFADALQPPMHTTQLTATLKPWRTPDPATLDRFSAALKWEPSILRRWYGYEVSTPSDTEPLEDLTNKFGSAELIAYVESKPDKEFQEHMQSLKAKWSPQDYGRLCLEIFDAWDRTTRIVVNATSGRKYGGGY